MVQAKPKRSIIDIKKFGGEGKEDIIDWIDMWERAVTTSSWTPGCYIAIISAEQSITDI